MTSITRWDEYQFPAWVPEAVCVKIRDFWREEWGRSPREWHEGATAEYNGHPPLGAVVEAESLTNSGLPLLRGRWVPLWNNIGCVVADDGSHRHSSTCGIRIIVKLAALPASPSDKEDT
jgi:hypothetical protein